MSGAAGIEQRRVVTVMLQRLTNKRHRGSTPRAPSSERRRTEKRILGDRRIRRRSERGRGRRGRRGGGGGGLSSLQRMKSLLTAAKTQGFKQNFPKLSRNFPGRTTVKVWRKSAFLKIHFLLFERVSEFEAEPKPSKPRFENSSFSSF